MFAQVLILTLSFYLSKQQVIENNEFIINDTIIQFFHNCSCIPYYSCSEINKFLYQNRAKITPQKIYCSDHTFICCKPDLLIEKKNDNDDVTEEPRLRQAEVSPKCGAAKTELSIRVLTPDVDSETTIAGEVPWIVEIFKIRKNSIVFRCAGTLIHRKVVITGTHCVLSTKPKDLKIIATGLESFQNININKSDERNVAKIIKHPSFYSGGLHNDVAVLILDKDFSFDNSNLNAICLPKFNQTFDGQRCIATGWGENLNLESVPLKKVDVPIVSSAKCENLLRKTRLGDRFKLHESFICAGGEEGKDTCKGDGGGPLMCLDDYKFVLAGIVSWGVECGVIDRPGLYTNVGLFVDWIKKGLDENGITLSYS